MYIDNNKAFIEHEVKNNTFVTNSRNLLKNPVDSKNIYI